ncbi:uncharacterized protein JCM6883_002371 [Sporobolomyces salmoneus]|uniref:uncharacterized protein n=1 Tax=Sporobolomyces salmoneus TaxID=183962 RepID=UPI00316E9496
MNSAPSGSNPPPPPPQQATAEQNSKKVQLDSEGLRAALDHRHLYQQSEQQSVINKASNYTVRKPSRPPLASDSMPRPPPSALTPSPSQPLPPTTTTSTPSIPSGSNAAPSSASNPPLFPALHLTPLNNTFVPKQISLDPPGVKVKIGRQTNAKTVPNGTNGYFDSKVLSRAHAEVWSEENKVFIKDVKSSNGTFINGERLSPESAESDIFELHTDDVVEFGIDILTDDTKTIVHHKVAAKVHLVMNSDDAIASSREFNNWYRQAGEQNLQHQQAQQQQSQLGAGQGGAQGGQGANGGGQGMMSGGGGAGGVGVARRPARAPINAQNGLSFEHVLSRLQGELQKSRDTGSNLNDVNSTLCDVHDTLGGSAPPRQQNAVNGPLPYPTTSSFPPRAQPGASNESIQALQQQLNDLASHVGRIRDLEGMLKEQEGVREEVENLRRLMEENGRREEIEREREQNEREREREQERNGRESPVARLLEREEREAEGEEEEDDNDTRSIASVDTVVEAPQQSEKKKQVNGGSPLDLDDETTSEPPPPPPATSSDSPTSTTTAPTIDVDELARERLVLQEQNAALTARLDALSAELDEAIQLGRSLQTQHAETLSTIKLLEDKIGSLETTVDERVEKAQGKIMRECEERWKGWKEVFEEGWKREKEGWREEREKLWEVVKEWEERKKRESEAAESAERDSDGSYEDDDDNDQGASPSSSTAQSPSASTSPKKRSTRRRKRSTIVPTPSASHSTTQGGDSSSSSSGSSSSTSSIPTLSKNHANSLAANDHHASDSDSTIGGEAGSRLEGSGKRSSSLNEVGSRSSGLTSSNSRTQPGLPVSWAGAVVVIAVAVGYGAALKLKE